MRPLRMLSLCSGIGVIDYVWSFLLGQEIAGQIEIDPFCQLILDKHWPDVPRYLDLKEVATNGDISFGAVDLMAGGIPCFVAGTMILTKQGYIPIEEVAIGEEVLTHLGRWRKVTSVMVRDNENLRRVKAQGVPGVITTDEHPFYTRKQAPKWNTTLRQYERVFSGPEWVEAQHLNKQCYVGQVLPEIVDDDRSLAFWWLVGRYLADGWRQKRPQRKMGGWVIIACAPHELEEVKQRIQDAGYACIVSPERTVVKVRITRVDFYNYLEPFGRYAHGKKIPGFVFQLPPEKIRALIEGYFSGDGYRDTTRNVRSATTVSKSLALSFALLAQRAFGVVSSVHKCIVKPTTIIEGRTVNQRDFWIVSIPDRNRSGFLDGPYAWKLVRASDPCGTGTVYNISVQEDESYVADGAVVHNCQSFSNAGKRRGTKDDRHLWPSAFTLLQRLRPTWVLLENVPGFIHLALDVVQADLESEGYQSRAYVLPACAVGAPHIRERVFIMAYTNRHGESSEACAIPNGQCSSTLSASLRQWADTASVADSSGQRWQTPRSWQQATASLQCGQDGMAHTEHGRRQRGSEYEESSSATLLRSSSAARSEPQPRVGRSFDGIADWLDAALWPAPPGQPQYAWEPARTLPAQQRSKTRARRLKALGNAIVPQQIYPLLASIVAWEEVHRVHS